MKKVFCILIAVGILLTGMSVLGFSALNAKAAEVGASIGTEEYTNYFAEKELAASLSKDVIISDGDYISLFCVQQRALLLVVGLIVLIGSTALLIRYNLTHRSENDKPVKEKVKGCLVTLFVVVISLRKVIAIAAVALLGLAIWGMITAGQYPGLDFHMVNGITEALEALGKDKLIFGDRIMLSCAANSTRLLIAGLISLSVAIAMMVVARRYAEIIKGKNANSIRANSGIYTVLVLMSVIWLAPFIFLILQSFRSYAIEAGGMVNYVAPKYFSLDNYRFLFNGVGFNMGLLVANAGAIVITCITNLAGALGIVAFLRRKPKNPLEKTQSNMKAAVLLFMGVMTINFIRAIDSSNCDFVQWFINTLTIAFFCAIIQTAMVLAVSYALSRIRFKGRKLLMNVVLVLGMFPGFLTMIVLYYLLKMLGLTQAGAIPGLILISCASSGMGYYISKGFFDTIPKSLDESARIDGATRFQVFLKIIMPMAKPIVIYTVLMAFMGPWGDYVFASYVAFGYKGSYNVAVGLYRWVNTADYQGYFTRFCAGGVLVAIPITALFMALQKYYVEGVTGGAVKG